MVFRNLIRKIFFFILYYQNPPWDTGISPPELIDFIQSHPPGRALDLGCGTGTNVITLAQHGWKVSGIDFIPKAIRAAKKKIKESGVDATVSVGDVTRLNNQNESVDLALDIGCYHNLNQSGKRDYEYGLQRILSDGGRFLLYGFLKTPDRSFGIEQEDLVRLQEFLTLEDRIDGTDRERPTAWFKFLYNQDRFKKSE